MKFLITALLTALFGWLLGLWLPFWSLAIGAVLAGFLVRPGGWRAFVAGFIAGVVLWGGFAAWIDAANAHLLSARIGQLFGTGSMGMVLITALLGGLLAGLGCTLGHRLRGK